MLKKTKKTAYIILFVLCIIVGWNILAYYYSNQFHEEVKNSPQRYIYDISKGVLNPVMVITDLKYKDALADYYDKLSSGEPTSVFNFPLKSILSKQPVHVIGATPDSLLIEVVLYPAEYEKGNYMRGYVDRRTLHKLPAPDSLWIEKSKVRYNMEDVYYWDSIQSLH